MLIEVFYLANFSACFVFVIDSFNRDGRQGRFESVLLDANFTWHSKWSTMKLMSTFLRRAVSATKVRDSGMSMSVKVRPSMKLFGTCTVFFAAYA